MDKSGKALEKKIKVLHIVEAFGGGVYEIVKSLAEGTCEEFDVTVAYSWRPQTPRDFVEKMDPRVHLIELQHFGREINAAKDFRATIEGMRLIAKINPDVIHLHSSKAGAIGRIAINMKKYRVLYTPHGYSFIGKDKQGIKPYIYKTIERLLAKRGGLTVACSKGELEKAKLVTKHAIYINNGIDTKDLPARKETETDGFEEVRQGKRKLHVCNLGRICQQKNPALFNRVAAAFPDAQFTWIGDGSKENKQILTSPNITVTGWKEPALSRRIASEQDVLLLPSLWEGLPLSLLECMYMGVICIGSRIPGMADVIKDGETGFLADSYGDYVRTLKGLLEGRFDTGKIARASGQEIETYYTKEYMCRQYSQLYRREAAKRKR